LLKNKELHKIQMEDVVKRIEDGAEGYLIMLTIRKGDTLYHTYFTNDFKRGDMMLAIDEHAKQLEAKEVKQI